MRKFSWILRTFQTRELAPLRTLWKALVQPHQDYCSQLWAPVGLQGDLGAQETPLRSFTRGIRGLRSLPYWERLQACGLQSTERRQDRYRLLYAWKTIKGIVPNCGLYLDSSPDSRRGRTLAIPPMSGSRMAIQSLKDHSFQTEAPRLWNSLPRELRDLDSTFLVFKTHLDIYLASLPDQPAGSGRVPAATDSQGKPSNSVRDWGRWLQHNADTPGQTGIVLPP